MFYKNKNHKTETSKIKRVFNIFCKKKIKNKNETSKTDCVDWFLQNNKHFTNLSHTKCRIQQVWKLKHNKNDIWPPFTQSKMTL